MGANLGQWEADTKACFEQLYRESSEFRRLGYAKAVLSTGNQWETVLVLWAGACLWVLKVCTIAERQIFLVGWLYLCSTELFASLQPAWERSRCCLPRARRGKSPLVSYDPALPCFPSQGNSCIKYCQRLVHVPTVTKLQLCFWFSWTVLPIFLHRWKIKSQRSLLAQVCGIIVFLVHAFAHWSWFEAAFWDLCGLLTLREITELLLCFVFRSPCFF